MKMEGGDDSSVQKDMKGQSQQTIVSGQLLLRDIFPEFPDVQTHLSILSCLPLSRFLSFATYATYSLLLPPSSPSFFSFQSERQYATLGSTAKRGAPVVVPRGEIFFASEEEEEARSTLLEGK